MHQTIDNFSMLVLLSELPLETTDPEVVKRIEFNSNKLLNLFTP
jgi:hypothetical protein